MLNAKYHEQEAEIIAQAGRSGVVTIATNMAGRGTDIVLGGNLEVELASQGETLDEPPASVSPLTGRRATMRSSRRGSAYSWHRTYHESRRIDNQLRGRSDDRATRSFPVLSLARGQQCAFLLPTGQELHAGAGNGTWRNH